MRRMLALTVMIVVASSSSAQPPRERGGDGGGRRGEGGGGGGMMRMMGGSPDEMFDRFAKGKSTIRRDDLSGFEQMMFDRAAKEFNLTGTEINRDQFKQVFEQGQARMREGGMGGMMGGGGAPSPEMMDRFMEERFRRYDKNGDGLLQADEMPDSMKSERDKWDTNKDGFIDLNEYKAYAKARFETMRGERGDTSAVATAPTAGTEKPGQASIPAIDGDDWSQRPVVFRAGKLPKELPDWFTKLDFDVDGQVGLYEWVKGAKAIPEFREMDANDDSFLTAEEVLRFTSAGKSFNYNVAAMNNGNSTPAYGPTRDRRSGGGERNAGNSGGPANRMAGWTGGRPGGNEKKGDRPSGGRGDRPAGGGRPE